MAPRVDLQELLEDITPNVYFQPPNNVQLQYPCIIYKRDSVKADHGDNILYKHTQRYQVIVIDRNPDSVIPMAVARLPLCAYDRFYTANNLNHDVYNLFY